MVWPRRSCASRCRIEAFEDEYYFWKEGKGGGTYVGILDIMSGIGRLGFVTLCQEDIHEKVEPIEQEGRALVCFTEVGAWKVICRSVVSGVRVRVCRIALLVGSGSGSGSGTSMIAVGGGSRRVAEFLGEAGIVEKSACAVGVAALQEIVVYIRIQLGSAFVSGRDVVVGAQ